MSAIITNKEMLTEQAISLKRKPVPGWLKSLKENWMFHVLALPVIIKVFIFSYLPMFGLIIAFKEFNYREGILGSPWVGFQNFEFFFKSVDAWRITRNTILYNVWFIIIGSSLSAFFALLLFEVKNKALIKTYQTAYIMPHFLSWVVAGFAFEAIFGVNGSFNNLLLLLGAEERVNFYHMLHPWPLLLTASHLWHALGFAVLIQYAVLMGIDSEYFEAAELEGANKIQKAWYISVPFLKPMVVIQMILAVGKIFDSEFGLFYFIPKAMYNTNLYESIDVVDTYVFRALRSLGDIGMSSSVGLYKSVVGFILIMLANYVVKKIDKDLSLY